MTSTSRTKEAVDKLKDSNPFYNKYADKIAKMEQTSAEEFLDRIERVINPIKDGQSQARWVKVNENCELLWNLFSFIGLTQNYWIRSRNWLMSRPNCLTKS